MDRKKIELGVAQIQSILSGKSILFITTKNLDYIRNSQEIRLIKNYGAKYAIIGSNSSKYSIRILEVYRKLLVTNVQKYDLIFIGFAPQLVLPFWKFKFRKKTVVIDFFISMYDTLVNDRKRFNSGTLAARLLKYIDKSVLRNADYIIADTKAHGQYFAEELGAEKKKIIQLYLEADKKIYYPREVIRPDKLKDRFVVLYFGSVLPLQGVDIVLGAYDLLKNDNRFYFYMIGTLGNEFCKPESENIEYIDWLSQKELSDYIAMADICLAGHFNNKIEKAKRTIPGKAYIYDAMNKKMILGENKANRELFDSAENVEFVKMGDANALAEIIVRECEKKID